MGIHWQIYYCILRYVSLVLSVSEFTLNFIALFDWAALQIRELELSVSGGKAVVSPYVSVHVHVQCLVFLLYHFKHELPVYPSSVYYPTAYTMGQFLTFELNSGNNFVNMVKLLGMCLKMVKIVVCE